MWAAPSERWSRWPRGWSPERWRPGVFCLGEAGPLAEVVQQANLPCECLGVSRRNPVQAIGRLARSLRRFAPELVQSFMFHANLAARLAAPWAGSPWVVGGIRVAEHQKKWHLALDRLTAPLVDRLGLRLAGRVAVQPRRRPARPRAADRHPQRDRPRSL